ncbi:MULTISPECIES: hypothetical protein [Streptomycetaceae]|uniref:hypothetical protein n=1 Tax=Streptomycetaceae TaxID=2062 RepID=UPI0009399293|nr:hypothetical protein [Streptomyces sp. CB02056]OKI05552.1 hypothetical protein AMK13_19505 [Streptomyces sp. CB02056]
MRQSGGPPIAGFASRLRGLGHGVAAQEERRDRPHHLFAEADTQDNIRGTRWAALQAVVEFEDYFRTVKAPRP